MSPADIANCVNRAAAYAAEAGETSVSEERVYESLETHQLGGEVSSTKSIITPETLRRIAFHASLQGGRRDALELGERTLDGRCGFGQAESPRGLQAHGERQRFIVGEHHRR